MIIECDNNIVHDVIPFNKFNEDYKNKNIHEYNKNYKKYQEYYIKSLFLNNDVIQNLDIHQKFKDQFKIPLQLMIFNKQ